MTSKVENHYYTMANAVFSEEDRLVKLMEEIGEFMVAVTHLSKAKKDPNTTAEQLIALIKNLAVESADLQIGLNQVKNRHLDFKIENDAFYQQFDKFVKAVDEKVELRK